MISLLSRCMDCLTIKRCCTKDTESPINTYEYRTNSMENPHFKYSNPEQMQENYDHDKLEQSTSPEFSNIKLYEQVNVQDKSNTDNEIKSHNDDNVESNIKELNIQPITSSSLFQKRNQYNIDRKQIENDYVIEIYNNIAHHFDKKRANKWSWISDFIETTAENSTILDIGCGNGRNMKYTDRQFTGVDNCEKFIDICLNQSLNVERSDMTQLPFTDNSFDNILSIASFHHLSSIIRRNKAIKETTRVLKPGGKILLSVWSIKQLPNSKHNFNYGDNYVKWNDHDKIFKRYYYIFKLDELYSLFKLHNLKVVSHTWLHGNEVFILTK